ncbi:MAG: hypothetical protein JWL62_3215, partial [Hyphomicrobiales bacterium]|nr:hypothetical protein [Hyphomicrobiales bacterium]
MGSLVVLPDRAGAAAQPAHLAAILKDRNTPGFFEVELRPHLRGDGPSHRQIDTLASRAPLSVHGAGLGIGGEDPHSRVMLGRLHRFCERHPATAISEDLMLSAQDGPTAILTRICDQIDLAHEVLRRPLLLGNPGPRSCPGRSGEEEADLLSQIVHRTG